MRSDVSILGSTGSIGTSALDLIERLNALSTGEPRFRVAALAAHRSTERLIQQVRRFRPALACIGTEEAAQRVHDAVKDLGTRVVWGPAGLIEAATLPEADFVLAAIVGAALANNSATITASIFITFPLVKPASKCEVGPSARPVILPHARSFIVRASASPRLEKEACRPWPGNPSNRQGSEIHLR